MRKVTVYPSLFKESIITKALAHNGPSMLELAKENNIPYGTIVTWVAKMKTKDNDHSTNNVSRPQDRTAESKLQYVIDTISMTDDELGAYCRTHGIYVKHLHEWRKSILSCLDVTDKNVREQKARNKTLLSDIERLKREINRKDRALSEASALLILKKKANLIWGDKEDD